jgi:hypothetical protein
MTKLKTVLAVVSLLIAVIPAGAHLPYSRYPVRGRKKFEDRMKQFRSAFSHFECDIDELIDDGMRVAVRRPSSCGFCVRGATAV